MPIQSLPVELMRLILQGCSPDDLLAVQLTCQSLRILTEPLLYEDLNYHRKFLEPDRPKLTYLLRTLLYRPDLGHHIKCLRLPEQCSDLSTEQKVLVAEALANMIVHSGTSGLLTDTELLDFSKWEAALSWYPVEIVHMLILSSCPALDALACSDNVWENLSRVKEYLCDNFNQTVPLINRAISHLEAVKTIESGFDGVPIDTPSPMLTKVFTLSSVKTLCLTLFEWSITPGMGNERFGLPQSPNITTLQLHQSKVSDAACATILNACPNVSSLQLGITRYSCGSRQRSQTIHWLDCTSLGRAITARNASLSNSNLKLRQCRRASLKHLSVSVSFFREGWGSKEVTLGGGRECDGDPDGDPAEHGISGSLGSLKELSTLESLQLPISLLLGWFPERAKPLSDVLPGSLRELRLGANFSHWKYYRWNVKSVKEVLEEYILTSGVHIKSIKYVVWEYEFWGNKLPLEELREFCTRKRVDLEIIRTQDLD